MTNYLPVEQLARKVRPRDAPLSSCLEQRAMSGLKNTVSLPRMTTYPYCLSRLRKIARRRLPVTLTLVIGASPILRRSLSRRIISLRLEEMNREASSASRFSPKRPAMRLTCVETQSCQA